MLGRLRGPCTRLVRLLGELDAVQVLPRALADLELDVVPGIGEGPAVLLVLALKIAGALEEVLLAQPPVLGHRSEQELELRARLVHVHRVARQVLLTELARGPFQLRADVLLRLGVQAALAPVRVVLGEPRRVELQDHRAHRHGIGLDRLLDRRQTRVQIVRQLRRRRPVLPVRVLRHDRRTPAAVAVVDHRDVHRGPRRVDVRIAVPELEPRGLIDIAGDVAGKARPVTTRRLDLVARIERRRPAHRDHLRRSNREPHRLLTMRPAMPPAALPWGLRIER